MSEQREPQELTEQDLEKYGVWVKAGPEDVVDEADSSDSGSLSDYATAEPAADAGVSDEAELDIDLEDLSLEHEEGEPAVDDLGDLNDLDLEEEYQGESVELEAPTPAQEEPADLGGEILDHDDPGGENLEDFSLEDLDFEIEDEGGIEPTAEEIDLEEELAAESPTEEEELSSLESDLEEEDLDLGELEQDEELASLEEEIEENERAGGSQEGAEEDVVTLDDLGIEEPEDETDPFASLPEEEMPSEDEEEPQAIGEVDLSDLEEEESEESIPGMEGDFEDLTIAEESEEESFAAEELPELEPGEHDFTPDEAGIDIEQPWAPVNRLTPEEEEFFEEEEEGEGLPKEESGGIHTAAGSQPMDTQDREALTQITKELHEIRSDLADLKRVLSSGAGAGSSVPPAPPAGAPTDEQEAPAGGFFDEEDEDETIALTGDELDNILNTAEFTEEAGQAAELDDESEFYFGQEAAEEKSAAQEPVAEEMPIEEAPEEPLPESDLEEEEVEFPEVEFPEVEEPEGEEAEAPVEEITLEEIAEEEPEEVIEEVPEEEVGTFSPEEAPSAGLEEEEEVGFGDESQVDELAQLDIESELADVDELKDEEEEEEDLGEIDFDEIELGEELEEEEGREEATEEPAEASMDIGPEAVTEEDLIGEAPEEAAEAEEIPASPEDFAAHFNQMEKEEAVTDISEEGAAEAAPAADGNLADLPENLKAEIRSVLTYMDQLLEALPEEKIQEFAESEHFEVYRRLFEELGIDT